MRTLEEKARLYHQRRLERSPLINDMEEVRAAVNGDIVVPMPGRWADERPAEANLVQLGLDATAQRIASTLADVSFPCARPGFDKHMARSRSRRQAALGWLEASGFDLLALRRARFLVGYGVTPVKIGPDITGRSVPSWETLNPLGCFPAPPARYDDMVPADAIFAWVRSMSWLRRAYPLAVGFLPRREPRGAGDGADERVEVLEYIDSDEMTLVATGSGVGRPMAPDGGFGEHTWVSMSKDSRSYVWATELANAPNRAGRPLVVCPGRITLDRLMGQFTGMIPKQVAMARLAALELMAIEDGIVPDEWVVTHAQHQGPAIVHVEADGRRGQVGVIEGGAITTVNKNPGYKTDQYLARIERAQRLEGGVASQMGGENPTNVRTGRASDQVMAAAIDFPIAEHQKILARSQQAEIEVAIEVAKGWFGGRTVSFNVDWKGSRGPLTYVANDLFDTDYPVKVRYALAGADLNALTVRAGQKLGAGLISQRTARKMDPEIEDDEYEHDQTTIEALERALLDGISRQAAEGTMSPEDLAYIVTLVSTREKSLAEAVGAAQKRAQERQASDGEPGTPTGPVDPASPDAQPGLAIAGVAGAEAGVAVPSPGEGTNNITQLLRQAGTARQSMMPRTG